MSPNTKNLLATTFLTTMPLVGIFICVAGFDGRPNLVAFGMLWTVAAGVIGSFI